MKPVAALSAEFESCGSATDGVGRADKVAGFVSKKNHCGVEACLNQAEEQRRIMKNSTAFGKSVLRIAIGLAMALPFAAVAQTPLTFTKAFSPSTIGSGSVSTLRFDIVNNLSTTAADVAFTDNLPAGVTIAPGNVSNTCDGTVNAPSGGGTISLSDGKLGSNESCVITVDVTSSTVGTHTNTTGTLTSSIGNGGTANADLTVAADRPGFSKSFSPAAVFLGGRSTLTLTIDNTANASSAIDLDFTDNLPSGMVIADPANASTTCGTATIPPTLTATAGTTVIILDANGTAAFPALAAGASCSVTVDVIGNANGILNNVTGELTSTSGASARSSGSASAPLTVSTTEISLSKSFTDDPVAPGASVNLEVTIRNLAGGTSFNGRRELNLTNIAFTDDLDAALSGLAATGLPSSACGGTLSGTSTINLTGGSLGPGAVCTFSVAVAVPSGAATGDHTNTTSAITADTDLPSSITGNSASDTLVVRPIPTLTKEFTNDPVGAGGSVNLEFTIQNTSASSTATDIAFIDELTTFLPFPISATLPADGFCGAGSSLALISLGTERQGLSLTGGSLAASGSCTFSVDLDIPAGVASGSYTNTTDVITATIDAATVTGNPASDDLDVVGGPSLIKEFTDDPAQPGGTVTLEFTLTHDEVAPTDATGIAFTDDLNLALPGLVATGLPQNDVCGGGSSISGTSTLTFAGGSLAPGGSCTFSVTLSVPSGAAPGSHTNTTSMVTATVSGLTAENNPASDDLRVAGVELTKEFIDDPVLPGGTATLRFTIDNTSPSSPTGDATDIAFSDDLDNTLNNLAVTGTLPDTSACGTGSQLTATGGGQFLAFQFGALTAGTSCSFDVTLLVPAAAVADDYANTTSALQATIDSSTVFFDPARDDLTVAGDLLSLTKKFTDDPVSPGGNVNLSFTILNLSSSTAVSDIAFTDDLDAVLTGLAATGLPSSACGGTLSGTSTISLTGGSLGAGGSCSFSVNVAVPAGAAPGIYTNATSSISGDPAGGQPATDDLRIDALEFSKSFQGTAAPGDTVVLQFNIQNQGSDPVDGLSFTDDLDAAISGLVATGLPDNDVCGTGSVLDGTSMLTLTGGNLLGLGSCTFSVTLQVPGSVALGAFVNTTSDLVREIDGQKFNVAPPAVDALVVEQITLDDICASVQAIIDANPGSELADKMEDVLAKLNTAKEELAKNPPDNQAAAGALEGAVGDLEAAIDAGLLGSSEGEALINDILDIARDFAEGAIQAAINRGGDADKIAEAQQKLAEGDTLRSQGDYKDAAARYKDAISIAEGA